MVKNGRLGVPFNVQKLYTCLRAKMKQELMKALKTWMTLIDQMGNSKKNHHAESIFFIDVISGWMLTKWFDCISPELMGQTIFLSGINPIKENVSLKEYISNWLPVF
jgi:hypothetical protein